MSITRLISKFEESRYGRFLSVCAGIALVAVLALAAPTAHAQKKAKPAAKKSSNTEKSALASSDKGPWLIKWKGGIVSLPEFEAAYARMNGRAAYATTLDSLKDFLGVYADYRLKLEEASEEGLDQDPKVLQEIAGYRKMLAGPYIIEKEVTDPSIRSLYARRQYDVHAAHFLAYVRDWNKPADTLKAYQKAMRAIQMLEAGYPLSYIALSPTQRSLLVDHDERVLHGNTTLDTSKMENWEGSDDKATAKNGGDLGFFTAGMTVRQFEDAAYSLEPGQYTKTPVRTRFGYHVIYLYEKTPHTGGVHVEHILISMPKAGGVDTLPYYRRADSLLTLIRKGASFEGLAREASDDKMSAEHGGDIDTINREERRAEPAFDHAAFNLKDGEISGIVRTSLGYHIIKRLNGVRAKTFDESKEQLKQFYKRYFYDDDKDHYLASLRKQLNLKVDSSSIDYVMAHIDSSRTSADTNWSKKIADRSRPVFRMGDINWTVGSLVDTLNAQPGSPLARNAIKDVIGKNIDDAALTFEGRDMVTKYPEFEKIMDDYKNGIILFDLENKRVWSKVVPDSASERKYYEDHKAKYFWPERVDISEIFVTSDSISKQLYKRIMAGENFDTLAKKYTERPGFKQKAGHWGVLQRDENELATRAFDFIVDEVKEPFAFQGGFSIVRLNRRDPIHPKSFEEARQEVASQFQDDRAAELRTQWVEELRTKYGRQINEPVVVDSWTKQHAADQSAVVK
ncbi:MAG TPA: peptidylprolyl isomerase [Candidatus Kapabacteria bacterium]|nr:peptidylprolyl isomerase [Candidatus Kapabacteria bacterium]